MILDDDMQVYLEGAKSRHIMRALLDLDVSEWKVNHLVKGLHGSEYDWIAFDNTKGECLIEEFDFKADAVNWLKLKDK